MAFQAHHIDTASTTASTAPGAYTAAHAEHFAALASAGSRNVSDPAPACPVRPAWVPDDLYPFEDRWVEHRRQSRPLRRRGQPAAAPAAERQSQLVVRLARRHPWSAWRRSAASRPTIRASGCPEPAPASTTRRASQSQVVEAARRPARPRRDGRLRLRLGRADRARAGGPPPGARARARHRQHVGWPDDRLGSASSRR